jgi:hypothetical protein
VPNERHGAAQPSLRGVKSRPALTVLEIIE